MPDARLQRARALLPADYQFGAQQWPHVHKPARYDVADAAQVCRCGARLATLGERWTVPAGSAVVE